MEVGEVIILVTIIFLKNWKKYKSKNIYYIMNLYLKYYFDKVEKIRIVIF